LSKKLFQWKERENQSDLHFSFPFKDDGGCPASHVTERPRATFQTAPWSAAPGELW